MARLDLRGPLRWLLCATRRLLPAEIRDEIVEDLLAEYEERRTTGEGSSRAGVWLVWDVLTTDYVALHGAARRLRVKGAMPATAWTNGSRTGGGTMGSGRGTWKFELWHSLKVLWRARGFATLAVLTIGIGVGSVAAVSGIVSSILLEPLPYEDADRLFMVWQADAERGDMRINASAPLLHRWRERAESFAELAAYRGPGWTMVTDGPQPERVPSVRVTPNFFELLGVSPELGRGFVPADATPAGGTNVIVSRSLWERLGWDDQAIGSVVSLDETPRVVVGVMPAGFEFIERGVEVWYPYEVSAAASWDQWTLRVVGRLAPGVTSEAASTQVAGLHAALRADQPGLDLPPGVVVRSVLDELVGDVRGGLVASVAAVLLGLLIAAVNVGGLLLARNLARRPELVMMRALGASRRGIVRHVVWQAVALSAGGLGVGLILATVLLGAAPRLLPADLPRVADVSVDGLALVTAFASALVVALGCGLLSVPWGDSGLRAGTRQGRGHGRALSGILVGQTALAAVLLVSGGLLVRSFLGLSSTEPGIDPDGVLAVELRLPGSLADDEATIRQFTTEVEGRVAALRGVAGVGQIQRLPFAGGNWNSYVLDPESPVEEVLREADVRVITPGYLEAIRLPVLRGRGFVGQDGPDGPRVALVNERLAERLWPGVDPLGRRLVVEMFGDWDVEVVGVVGPVRHHGLATETSAEVYVPYAQVPVPFSNLVVRGDIDERLVSGIRAAVREVQPSATVSRATHMTELVNASIATQRMHAIVFGGLALLALVLAGVGTFGVSSFRVAQERHEMGLRAVLGASSAQLRLAVLLRTGRLVLTGIALGFAASAVLSRGLSSLLFGLAPTDPATYAVVAGVVGVLSLAAALLPAERAARADPIVAMREGG